ncbi:MAG: hypothetical protein ABIN69_07430 [Aestuariivirga sp.]
MAELAEHVVVKKYSQAQLDDVQGKFDLVFPPDLVALLRLGGLASHDWNDEIKIRSMLAWPMETLLFDVENNGLWWTEWGPRPEQPESRREVVARIIGQAPRLIPIYSHRFLPQTPSEAGNPVFSVYGSDTIYYGVNLHDYIQRETHGFKSFPWPNSIRPIPFWSDLVACNSH